MRVLGIVSYKGTKYQGWAKQPSFKTIQGEIESKLSQVLNCDTEIYGSGRTDAGVHACKQTFSFDVEKEVDLDKLSYSLNRMLDEDIKILSLSKVDSDFHARFSAKSKTYSYKIFLGMKEPFENEFKYVCPFDFDFDLFNSACKLFEGKHCFQDYTSKEEDEDKFIRKVFKVVTKKEGNNVTVQFTGNGFMRYQIRIMVGAALAVAFKNEELSFILRHLEEDKKRDIVTYKAPPQGLYLEQVDY